MVSPGVPVRMLLLLPLPSWRHSCLHPTGDPPPQHHSTGQEGAPWGEGGRREGEGQEGGGKRTTRQLLQGQVGEGAGVLNLIAAPIHTHPLAE